MRFLYRIGVARSGLDGIGIYKSVLGVGLAIEVMGEADISKLAGDVWGTVGAVGLELIPKHVDAIDVETAVVALVAHPGVPHSVGRRMLVVLVPLVSQD
ncbi:hypothetical protein AXG93_1660s1070 [Marchantia polymorpha subsp. ruderalis]|uniref:Uncharacterized protein n=1 Tax=Marchantia polymorpha subsp. ruderalis TaxID=1480154 RepID=A0A176VR17_MARPO|nr:hypothetical protein AXG93_1660s1070 [Marchantia polymorpha subsp. ruderalis]